MLAGIAAYSDSDEDQSPSRSARRRKSSENEHFSRKRSKSETEIPEAPASSAESSPSGTKAARLSPAHRTSSTWLSPEAGGLKTSDDGDSLLREPPPPRRHSRSPSTSRLNTPSKMAGLPGVSSVMSLVNYAADDEDDNEAADTQQPKTEDERKPGDRQASPILDEHLDIKIGKSESSSSMQQQQQKTTKDDADAELLKAAFQLQDRTAAESGGGTPQSMTGSESPGAAQTPAADEQAASPQGDDTDSDDVHLPPEPAMPCRSELIERFEDHFRKKARGVDFNMWIQRRKDFLNPSMYEKLIEHFGIDEIGSNFPKEIFDPHGFKSTDYYDKLSDAQKIVMERYNKNQQSVPKGTDLLEKKQRRSRFEASDDKRSKN